MRKFVEPDVADNPLYHDTWKLLKKYRDVVWSLELSVQHVRTKFEIEYGTSIEDFLDSVYLAGADLAGSDIEHHAKCIERTVHAVDGTAWYKQYAVDAVDKSPYMAPDGSIAFNESIVKKLPPAPRRKDKI